MSPDTNRKVVLNLCSAIPPMKYSLAGWHVWQEIFLSEAEREWPASKTRGTKHGTE